MAGRVLATLAATLVASVLMATFAASAHAAQGVTTFFGNSTGSGSATGEFNVPRAVAVNASGAGGVPAGSVYVADASNHRIQRFDSDGAFQVAFGSNGAAAGQFSTPTGVAVDQADGSVYVFDQGNRRVAKYTATGTFLFAFGAGVATGVAAFETCTVTCLQGLSSTIDGGFGTTSAAPSLAVAPAGAPNAGDVVVADPGPTANRRIQEFSAPGAAGPAVFVAKVGSSGSGNGQFGTNSPTRVAVDDDGRIYAIDTGNSRVQRFAYTAGPPVLAFDSLFATADLSGSPAPIDVAVDPGAAGGAADDRVFVVKPCTAVLCPDASVATERRIKELDTANTPTSLQETHMVGSGIGSVNGLGLDVSSDRMFVSSQSFGSPTTTAHRVYMLDEIVAPEVAVHAVTGIGSNGATLNGTVDPNGFLSSYRFEYSKDGTWIPFPPTDQDAGAGTSPQPVSATIASGLEPGTLYQVRLVATHTFGETSVTSPTTTFMTAAAAPSVAPGATADVDTTTATLRGYVNPNGLATTYQFEYGLDAGYGAVAPVPAGDAGSDTASVPVSASVAGLQPGTTYHFRLVASNDEGTTAGPDRVFTTRSVDPPAGRAYEQVSPVDKNGADISYFLGGGALSGGAPVGSDGSAAAFASLGVFAGQPHGGTVGPNDYTAERGDGGWVTTPVFPRPEVPGVRRSALISSADLRSWIVEVAGQLVDDDPLSGSVNVYRRNTFTDLTTPLFGISNGTESSLVLPMATPDLDHVVFASIDDLTADPGLPAGQRKVYEVVGDEIRLVSVQPDNVTPFPGASVPAGGSTAGGAPRESSRAGGISLDGRHIFFTTGSPGAIYRRSDGATTLLATPSKRTPPDPLGAREKIFRVATPDGNRVFFTSGEHLTNDANTGPSRVGRDLYRYDFDSDELVDISASSVGNGARVQGVVGIDESGSRVYYVGLGQIDGEGVDGQPNLYAWEDDGTVDGRTRFVATLVPYLNVNDVGDGLNWRTWDGDKISRVTPDGRFMIFQSSATIPGHDGGGVSQVYRYDLAGDGGAGDLECLSCNPDGTPPLGASNLTGNTTLTTGPWEYVRSISDDGRRVFFDSQDALVPQDSNGRYDAYMWEDGEVSLLSTGKSSDDARFFNASASGDSAFFLTREALVAQDGDDLVDLYDARVGGGFPPPPLAPGCSGEACQGGISPPPAPRDLGSDRLEGAGDADPGRRPGVRAIRLKRAQLARLARGKAVGVRVRTARRGKVRLVARAKIGKRRVVVARGSRMAAKPGRVVVRLRLNRSARRATRQGRSLRVRLRASAPGARPRSISFRVKGARS